MIEPTNPNTQKITSLAYWLTPEGLGNRFIADMVKDCIESATDEEFKDAFDGATKVEAAEFLARWELCYTVHWSAPELASAITLSDTRCNKELVLRAVSLAQSVNELPEIFQPKTGIQWAMARGYLIDSNICSWLGVQPGSYGHPSNPHSIPDNTIKAMKSDDEIRLLHLSDLHISTQDEATRYIAHLNTDLLNELQVKQLDYLILSGDISNKSTTEEYQAAVFFVEGLIGKFNISREKIIITPGNHDVSYELSEKGYEFVPSFSNRIKKFIGRCKPLINEEGYRQRFQYFNEDFYLPVTNNNYPLDYNEQAILHVDKENKLLILTLNSAWEIDHKNEERASIHSTALAKAINAIHNGNYHDWLKISVWHHPVTGKDPMNDEFLQQLVTNGFELVMHGHYHEAKDGEFKYDSNRGLHIIGAGTFGASENQRVTSIPLQYNLLMWNKKENRIIVNTRKKEHTSGAWKADPRSGDSNHPEPSYRIDLSKK